MRMEVREPECTAAYSVRLVLAPDDDGNATIAMHGLMIGRRKPK
jgi:hypothetical protein